MARDIRGRGELHAENPERYAEVTLTLVVKSPSNNITKMHELGGKCWIWY